MQTYATGNDGVAAEHSECPITFEPLHSAAVGVFVNSADKRVSQHFYSLAAAKEHLRSGNKRCPMTRRPISSVVEVPDVRVDPEGWFRVVDNDGNGRLSKREIVEALKAQLPIDFRRLDAEVDDPSSEFSRYWREWDVDGSGSVEQREVEQIAAVVECAFSGGRTFDQIPDIRQSKDDWYAYWDEDGSGTLEKEEVVRALVKTFNVNHDLSKVKEIRGTLDMIWCIFDDDGSGSIDRREFLRSGDGLADTIIAQIQHGGN